MWWGLTLYVLKWFQPVYLEFCLLLSFVIRPIWFMINNHHSHVLPTVIIAIKTCTYWYICLGSDSGQMIVSNNDTVKLYSQLMNCWNMSNFSWESRRMRLPPICWQKMAAFRYPVGVVTNLRQTPTPMFVIFVYSFGHFTKINVVTFLYFSV